MKHPLIFLPLFFLLLVLTGASNKAFAQDFQWAKGEGGIGNDAAYGVAADDAGNTYVTGNIAGKADFSGTVYQGSGLYDVFLAKYGSTGDLLWVKLAGGTGNEQGNAVKCKNGFVYVCGSFEGTATFGSATVTSKGGVDAFVAKYDDNGSVIWVKSAGGTGKDHAITMDIGSNGDVLVAGAYDKAMQIEGVNLTTANIYYESFYARYSSTGSLLWAKSTTGSNVNLINGLAFDHNNALYITGFFGGSLKADNTTVTSLSPSFDVFLAKVNEADGSLSWIKRAGSSYEDAANAVTCDLQGNPTITGYFAGTAYFDNNQVAYRDYNDIFTARYDANGNNLWVRAGKGQQVDIGHAIASDAAGNLFVTGMFQVAADFDGNPLTGTDRDIFITSYDKNGTVRWVTRSGGSDTDAGLGIAVQSDGAVAVCGYYLHTATFGSIAIEYADGNDMFIAKYSPPPVGITNVKEDLAVEIYPNPANSYSVLKTDAAVGGGTYTIYNQVGAVLYSGELQQTNRITLNNCAAGIYYVHVKTANAAKTLKLVKN